MTKAEAIAPEAAAIDRVKSYLRIDGTAEDEAIGALICAAIGHGEQFTGQMLATRAIEETLPAADGWRRLPMRE